MKKQFAMILTAILAGGALCTTAFAGEEAQSTRGAGAGQSATSGTMSQQELERQRQGAGQQQAAQESQFKAMADLDGMTIQNMQGQQLGQIDQVLVDMNEGRLAFVVVSAAASADAAAVAGDQNYIVPWQMVRTTPQQDGLMLNVSSISQLHPIAAGEPIEQTLNRQTGEEIFQFYGISPYWEESGRQQMPQDQMHRQMMEQMPQDPMHQQMRDRMQQPERQQPIPSPRP